MKCPYCGSPLVIERDGQYVCTSCGTVLGSVYVYDTYTQSIGKLDDEEIDLTPIWKSVEKVVKKDISGKLNFYRRLRIINNRLRRSRETYSIHRAFECMEFIAKSLGINEEYINEAKIIFRKIMSSGNVDATYYQMAVASMLYVILTHNLPVSTKLVINVCKSRGHKLNTESIREALLAMGAKYSVRDRILSHVRLGLAKLLGDSWVTLYPQAENFLNNLKRSFIQSKSPVNLAALIVYCVSRRQGYEFSIDDVAKVMHVSPFTLKDYVNKLCPLEHAHRRT